MEHLRLLSEVAPFGTAGLIAWMWIVERRAAAEREQQLNESHRKLVTQQLELDTLVTLVRENTRAVSSLEAAQRRFVRTLLATVAGERRSRESES
jgi:hypothetical protein